MADRYTILSIHAHPDDIEFQVGGLLIQLSALGHRLVNVTMTAGDKGSSEMDAETISTVRRQEAKRAADLVGAEYYCLEFKDLEVCHDNPSRKRVTELFRKVRPDIVLTAPPVDYMSDHEITSRLVRDAAFNASVPNYKTDSELGAGQFPPTNKPPYLYYMDAVDGSDWFGNRQLPTLYVDITQDFDRKREMCACHVSQREWLLRQHGIDEYLNMVARWGNERGKEVGSTYAEALVQHRGHPHPHDDLLARLLGNNAKSK